MKASLYDLLQASMSDPDSPNILLTVHLSDLHQLMVDTIEATRERILPIFMEAEKDIHSSRYHALKHYGIQTLHSNEWRTDYSQRHRATL